MNNYMARNTTQLLTDLLRLLEGDLGCILRDADQDCTAVCQSLSDIASATHALSFALRTHQPELAVHENSRRIGTAVSATIVGLQYHDRLMQRIALIRTALERVDLSQTTVTPSAGLTQHLLEIEVAYRLQQHRLQGNDFENLQNEDQVAKDAHVELF